MATEESLIVGVVLVVVGVLSAIYGTILCFTTKVCVPSKSAAIAMSCQFVNRCCYPIGAKVSTTKPHIQWDVSACTG